MEILAVIGLWLAFGWYVYKHFETERRLNQIEKKVERLESYLSNE